MTHGSCGGVCAVGSPGAACGDPGKAGQHPGAIDRADTAPRWPVGGLGNVLEGQEITVQAIERLALDASPVSGTLGSPGPEGRGPEVELTAAWLSSRFRGVRSFVPSWLADELLGCGEEAEVRRQARLGEWHCAEQLARLLAERGQLEGAVDELRPYCAAGWPLAVCSAAALLGRAGRAAEAVDLLRR